MGSHWPRLIPRFTRATPDSVIHVRGTLFGTAARVYVAGAVGQNRPCTPSIGASPGTVEETVTGVEQADRPGRLSVERRVVGGVRVVTVQGEIDHDVENVLGAALLFGARAAQSSRVVVDLSGVTFMDSSGISLVDPRVGVDGVPQLRVLLPRTGPGSHLSAARRSRRAWGETLRRPWSAKSPRGCLPNPSPAESPSQPRSHSLRTANSRVRE
uniref:STAS domain-containing protein n=1 Tax=Streptomyces asoensis TaxID=249586 RepID=UPI003460E363